MADTRAEAAKAETPRRHVETNAAQTAGTVPANADKPSRAARTGDAERSGNASSVQERRSRAEEVGARLEAAYPKAHIMLHFEDDWELLVAVILSAQCTDKKVNEVTAGLFKKYRTIEDYAGADPARLEEDIRPTGFFRNKTKHIQGAAQKVLHEFGGEVPHSMAELLTLPGVARKTANIVLGNADPAAFAADPDAGIAVDTHVDRLSHRLGLATAKDTQKTELELMEVIPRDEWSRFTYLIIEHGRAVCDAKKPDCPGCMLNDICPSAFAFPHLLK
jgi:endonuclease-3